jgi:peptide/nickel transport system ATP-binding protein
MSNPILTVENLSTSFPSGKGRVSVVDQISFEIQAGEIMALVGESGCGKSMTALSTMRLVPKPGRVESDSTIILGDKRILDLSVPDMRNVRGTEIAMIFQEPMTSLNPVQVVGKQVVEGIRLHERISFSEARRRVIELFDRVGIPDPAERFSVYPHQLSGGLKQRVMIAMAISTRSSFLIADEPTTALDVTVQAQILDLLHELRNDLGTAILLITHDLGVVNELADRVAVMYAGKIIERGSRLDILHGAQHPYTQGLLRSIPGYAQRGARLNEIPGVVPQPNEWPKGCRFSTRCSRVFEPCADVEPGINNLDENHSLCCHAVEQEASP